MEVEENVLESEIEEAIKQMKDRKAEGVDEIPGEMLRVRLHTAINQADFVS